MKGKKTSNTNAPYAYGVSGPANISTLAISVRSVDTATCTDDSKWAGKLDDSDVWATVKFLQSHDDPILNLLSNGLMNRKLFRIEFYNKKPKAETVNKLKVLVAQKYAVEKSELNHLVTTGFVSNEAYVSQQAHINILTKKNEVIDVAMAADLPNIKAISKIVRKYYLCWPKDVSLLA